MTLRAAESSELHEYVQDVEATAATWSLNRLPDSLGATLIHRWIPLQGAAFGALYMVKHDPALESDAGAGRIDVPFVWVADGDEHVESRGSTDAVVLTGPPSGVRERLRAICEELIDAEVERIAGRYEAAGYVFADTRPDHYRHIEWWFKRYALGFSCARIGKDDADLKVSDAAIWEVSEGAVRKATDAISRDLSLPPTESAAGGHVTVDSTGEVVS